MVEGGIIMKEKVVNLINRVSNDALIITAGILVGYYIRLILK